MGIHEALKGEGYILEYGQCRGEDWLKAPTNRDRQMAGRSEWMRINEEGWWR